jgi:hypothetical protein
MPVDPTVATLVLSLVQVPPVVASDNKVEEPGHENLLPVIGAGSGFTVTALVVLQPVGCVKVIVAVPETNPVTVPVVAPTATLKLVLLQVPPPASLSVMVVPSHSVAGPLIAAGNESTVTRAVATQPVAGNV